MTKMICADDQVKYVVNVVAVNVRVRAFVPVS